MWNVMECSQDELEPAGERGKKRRRRSGSAADAAEEALQVGEEEAGDDDEEEEEDNDDDRSHSSDGEHEDADGGDEEMEVRAEAAVLHPPLDASCSPNLLLGCMGWRVSCWLPPSLNDPA